MTGPAADYFDQQAAHYEEAFSDASIWAIAHRVAVHLLDRALAGAPAAHVADIGCGTGKWGRRHIDQAETIDFVDLSERMVGESLALATRRATATRVRGVVAPIEAMPQLESARYGLTLAMGDPLSYTHNARAAVAELVRITAPRGLIFVSVDARLGYLRIFRERNQYDLDALETFLRTGDVVGWEGLPLHAFTRAELAGLFQEAGAGTVGIWELPTISSFFLFEPEFARRLEEPRFRDRLLELELEQLESGHALGVHHLYGLFRRL